MEELVIVRILSPVASYERVDMNAKRTIQFLTAILVVLGLFGVLPTAMAQGNDPDLQTIQSECQRLGHDTATFPTNGITYSCTTFQPVTVTVLPASQAQQQATPVPQPEQNLGDVNSWRGAGDTAGCPGYPNLTTAFVQESFGVGIGVMRIANYPCVWGASGEPQQLNYVDGQFEVYDVTSQQRYASPQALTLSNFLIVHTPSFPGGFDYQAYVDAQNASCERLTEINAQSLSAMISAVVPQDLVEEYTPIRLVKNEGEDCGFYVRHGRFALLISNPELLGYDIEFTIHPFGDDTEHGGGVDDEVFVTYGRYVTGQEVFNAYAMTVRVVERTSDGRLGYSIIDAVNRPCELWWKEFANGLIEVPQFGVYPLGYRCEYDMDFVQNVLDTELQRSDVTAPDQPTLYGASWEGAWLSAEPPFQQ